MKQVLELFQYIDSQNNDKALLDLLTRSDAVTAWEKLSNKVSSEDDFLRAVEGIGQAAMRAYIPEDRKLTENENRESCEEAARLAKRLGQLIAHNANLRPSLELAVSPVKRAALDRILGGVMYQQLLFSEEAEKELKINYNHIRQTVFLDSDSGDSFEVEYSDDDNDVRAWCQKLDTSDAYKILRGYWDTEDDFTARLNLFATKATEAAEWDAITGRPKSKNVDQRIFSVELCGIFSCYCGSPNYDLVADFGFIVFDVNCDSDTIKKWFKRDNLRQ